MKYTRSLTIYEGLCRLQIGSSRGCKCGQVGIRLGTSTSQTRIEPWKDTPERVGSSSKSHKKADDQAARRCAGAAVESTKVRPRGVADSRTQVPPKRRGMIRGRDEVYLEIDS